MIKRSRALEFTYLMTMYKKTTLMVNASEKPFATEIIINLFPFTFCIGFSFRFAFFPPFTAKLYAGLTFNSLNLVLSVVCVCVENIILYAHFISFPRCIIAVSSKAFSEWIFSYTYTHTHTTATRPILTTLLVHLPLALHMRFGMFEW